MIASALNRRSFRTAHALTLLTLVAVLAGCAPANSGTGGNASTQAPAAPKVLRIGTLKEPTTGIAVYAGSSNMSAQHMWMFHAGHTVTEQQDNIQPRVAAKVPSVEGGDWKVAPDGSMEVTWKLRPNVLWHDGTPLTAEDFVLGIRVARDPELPLPRTGQVGLISDVLAPDTQTLIVRWSQPYFGANQGGPADVPAVPNHIMGALYQAGDKKAFTNSSYWTTEFVGLGPYRLGQWEPGSFTEALAFDSYFLGRPKIDRIIIRYITDATVLSTNLMSGDVDLVAIGSLKYDDLLPVKAAWGAQGGTVIEMMSDVTWGRFQFKDPTLPWQRDPRVRQALVHTIDRQTLADTFFPGGGSAPADMFLSPEDPAFRLAEQRSAKKYPYDLTTAARLFGESGWTKGVDGIFQRNGQPFSIEVRIAANTPGNVQQGLALADQWKRGGLDSPLFSIPGTATDKAEQKALGNRGVFIQPTSIAPDVFEGMTSAVIASESNGWSGANISGYNNPEYERLYAAFANELDPTRRTSRYADVAKFAADEVIFLPLYYSSGSAT
ncbi:MAG TPA: ABC transporter substrate-binding protein, partial [Chloroflexota bacterium]